jgi:hypothetical protein
MKMGHTCQMVSNNGITPINHSRLLPGSPTLDIGMVAVNRIEPLAVGGMPQGKQLVSSTLAGKQA